jgi:hypothetical protein
MFYISKGVVYKESDIENVHISRCGNNYILHENQAKLWLAGRFSVVCAENIEQQFELRELESIGLVEITEPDDTADYQLLTNCVICKVNPTFIRFPLSKNEKLIWTWIKNAAFKLTISELVYLIEQNIIPSSIYFGKDNWHTLIHAIYTKETIFDRILDARMEESSARNKTVSAVLGLLRKKRVVLV